MKHYALTVGAALITGWAALSGEAFAKSGNVIQTYDFDGFDRIRVSAVHALEIRQGESFSVRTETSAENAEWSRLDVKGDTLVIGRKDGYDQNRKNRDGSSQNVKVFITMPRLSELDTSGVTTARIDGFDGGDIDIDTSGVTTLELEGACDTLDLDTSGVADIDALSLICDTVETDASGVSKVKVHAARRIDVDASGMSKVWVHGNPSERRKSSSGSGNVFFK